MPERAATLPDIDGDDTIDRRRHVRRLAGGVVAILIATVVGYVAVRSVSGDGARGEDDGPPQVGSFAPDFSVRTLDGGVFSLRAHIEGDGRPLLLNMWAEWCFPCRSEMPAIDAAADQHPEIHFIGVVVDDDEAPARQFVEDLAIGYQIGLDDDRVVKRSYDVWAMPSTYLIDADGTIVDRVFGPLREEQLEALIGKVSS